MTHHVGNSNLLHTFLLFKYFPNALASDQKYVQLTLLSEGWLGSRLSSLSPLTPELTGDRTPDPTGDLTPDCTGVHDITHDRTPGAILIN